MGHPSFLVLQSAEILRWESFGFAWDSAASG
jgi:hypothetical protein